MPIITELGTGLYRISTYVPEANLQFNQFLIPDDEPLLFHTGLKALFPVVSEAVATIVDPSRLRWIAFSHYEADECGTLNDWLSLAPSAEPLCSMTAKIVSVDDVSVRPAHGASHGEVIATGKHRFRFLQTPHLPHAWESGLLFEETTRWLICSDLFHQSGDVEPWADRQTALARTRDTLVRYQSTPLANYLPYTPYTERLLGELAELQPRLLTTMHGSAIKDDGETALRELAGVMKEVYGAPDVQPRAVTRSSNASA